MERVSRKTREKHDKAVLAAYDVHNTPFSASRMRGRWARDEKEDDEREEAEFKKYRREHGQKEDAKQLEELCRREQRLHEENCKKKRERQDANWQRWSSESADANTTGEAVSTVVHLRRAAVDSVAPAASAEPPLSVENA